MGQPADRHIYLSIIDSMIMAQMRADAKAVEAENLSAMWHKAHQDRDHALEGILAQKHTMALGAKSEYKGQYIAYSAMRRYMARIGYKFV